MEEREKVQNPQTQEELKPEQTVEKLSYEQLEGIAKQMSAQIDYLAKENQKLKAGIQQLQLGNMYTELDFKFKVLKHADFFRKDFVENIIKNIEDTMTPAEVEQEDSKEEDQ